MKKWYKIIDGIIYVDKDTEDGDYTGIWSGMWYDEGLANTGNWEEATDAEVTEEFIKVLDAKGFTKFTKFHPVSSHDGRIITERIYRVGDCMESPSYSTGTFCWNGNIWHEGTWAEIVKEEVEEPKEYPTLDEVRARYEGEKVKSLSIWDTEDPKEVDCSKIVNEHMLPKEVWLSAKDGSCNILVWSKAKGWAKIADGKPPKKEITDAKVGDSLGDILFPNKNLQCFRDETFKDRLHSSEEGGYNFSRGYKNNTITEIDVEKNYFKSSGFCLNTFKISEVYEKLGRDMPRKETISVGIDIIDFSDEEDDLKLKKLSIS